MQFLDLPLVLVQDILELAVVDMSQRYSGYCAHDILRLRRVNSTKQIIPTPQRKDPLLTSPAFFEREITKLYARFKMQGSVQSESKVDPIPKPFLLRLMTAYVGETSDRRKTHFATKMHAVAEFLLPLLQVSHASVTRESVVRDICKALIASKYHYKIFDNKYQQEPPRKYQPGDRATARTALLVAIFHQRNDVMAWMLENGKVHANGVCRFLGWPIDMAIQHGYYKTAKMLFAAGADVKTEWRRENVEQALVTAATAGHTNVVLLVLEHLWDTRDFRAILKNVSQAAIKGGHCGIGKRLVERYWTTTDSGLETKDLMEFQASAALYGRIEIVQKYLLMKETRSPADSEKWLNSLLLAAAEGEQLAMCRLLLENGAGRRNLANELTMLWRYAARLGDMEMVRLFDAYEISKRPSELFILPIAAEYGHVNIAQYAVSQKLDRALSEAENDEDTKAMHRVKEATTRQAALCRAIVNNHEDMVRYLVTELEVPLQDIELPRPRFNLKFLSPLLLAIDIGQPRMARLLLDLGYPLPPLLSDYEVRDESGSRRACLDELRKELAMPIWNSRRYVADRGKVEESLRALPEVVASLLRYSIARQEQNKLPEEMLRSNRR